MPRESKNKSKETPCWDGDFLNVDDVNVVNNMQENDVLHIRISAKYFNM